MESSYSKKLLIIIVCILLGANLVKSTLKLFEFVAELPTHSESGKLELAQYLGFTPEKIIVKHYVNNKHVCDYELDLEQCLNAQTSHRYDLPKLMNGSVEICVYGWGETNNQLITKKYEKASELYLNGLLIYFDRYFYDYSSEGAQSFDDYVYFVSGCNRANFVYNGDGEWSTTNEAPKIRKYVKPDEIGYMAGDNDCGKNKWQKVRV